MSACWWCHSHSALPEGPMSRDFNSAFCGGHYVIALLLIRWLCRICGHHVTWFGPIACWGITILSNSYSTVHWQQTHMLAHWQCDWTRDKCPAAHWPFFSRASYLQCIGCWDRATSSHCKTCGWNGRAPHLSLSSSWPGPEGQDNKAQPAFCSRKCHRCHGSVYDKVFFGKNCMLLSSFFAQNLRGWLA